jgi:formylglycine-generating enzyme required for sulfatase activity
MALNPGDTLFNGHYQIVRLLGRGGFGFVYQARDTLLNQTVAIKELIPALVGDQAALKRFLAEARATMRLTHRHIVRTHNVFQEGDNYYIVMEYMAGGSLEHRLRERGALPVDEAVRAAAEVCAGLACAHEEQVIHCDLKPANILFDAAGRAKVADFGIAHVSGEMLTRSWHTPAGFVAGTLPYMSPEQLDGVRDDPRVDVYALGAVFYRMLTGQPYLDFEPEETPRAQVANVSRIYNDAAAPPSRHNPLIPAWLDAVVLRALAKDPEARYSTTEDMRAALLQLEPKTTHAESPALAETTVLTPDEAAVGVKLTPDKPAPPARERRTARPRWVWPAVGGAVVLLIALGIALAALFGGWDSAATVTRRPTQAAVEVASPAHQAGDARLRDADGMIELYVPAGGFTMGSEESDNESPGHYVYLDSFWIDRTEVTNARYRRCVDAGACDMPTTCDDGYPNYEDEDKAQRPVVCVEWSQAEAYCAWAGARLPTEAEWEKAARGDDRRRFPWGDEDPTCDRVNTKDETTGNYCVGETIDVGSYPSGASPYGALDMAGNVWEWVADWYNAGYYAESPPMNPQGPDTGANKVLRGGCWEYSLPDVRAAFRNYDYPDLRRHNIGFRCAASAEE